MKRLVLLVVLLFVVAFAHAINPVREYKITPEKMGVDYEEVKITTSDKCQLNTWIMHPAAGDKKPFTIVIAYGDGGNMGFMMGYAMGLLRLGYTVITFDYRGFGASDDFEINRNYYYYNEFATDLVSVLQWAKTQKGEDQLGVLAFSMGTAMAALAFKKEAFDFLIGEGVVYDPIVNVGRIKILKDKELILPKKAKKLKKYVQKLDVPALLFAALKDDVTPLEDTQKVASFLAQCEIIKYDGEHLAGAATLGLGAYFSKIEQWIQELDKT